MTNTYDWKFPCGLNELALRVFQSNVTKGFWGDEAKTLLEFGRPLSDVTDAANGHRSPWEIFMLIVSEAAEAGEAWRDGAPLDNEVYELKWHGESFVNSALEFIDRNPHPFSEHGKKGTWFRVIPESEWTFMDLSIAWQRQLMIDRGAEVKPVGIPSELADVIIRVLDACGAWEIDIVKALEEKMNYNNVRPALHGRVR